MIEIFEAMIDLSPEQKIEADQLFSKALQSAKNNDYFSAAKLYGKAASYGHPGAQNNLANQYKSGRGITKDLSKAFDLFLESAQHGNTVAMRNLSICYMDGSGTEANFDVAVEWLETAADKGDNLACVMLAKTYDNWNHKDEEKKIFWHKRAAELGNSDSMLFLGEYYKKAGDKQDLSLAKQYLEKAALTGNSDMKLKVAKAFDIPSWGNEIALSLDRAFYWYNEVVSCGDDKQKFEAAKGLDGQFTHEGELRRVAFNPAKAYMTYRTLGMSGNKEACALAAYCSEIGNGTDPKIDIAIMLYEKAGYKAQAEWCKKKKSGKLEDEVYIKHLLYEMPELEKNLHSSNSEYYNGDVYSKVAEYNGRMYYIRSSYNEYTYLCSSDLEGENIIILTDINSDFGYAYVHANETGIYLYYTGDYGSLWVLHYSYEGILISECKEGYEAGHSVSHLYFYDNDLYYVYNKDYMDESICLIKCMHIDKKQIKVLYEKATSISKLYATADDLIFLARYENDECEELWVDGWMILNIDSGLVECISNPFCNPECVIDDPEIYGYENPRYNDQCNYDRNIVFFDLNRLVFWTCRYAMEGDDSKHLKRIEYWEPHYFKGDRDSVVGDLPIWKMDSSYSSVNREYFDGIHHYYSEGYYVFKSSDKYGNIYDWSTGNGGHGVCDDYRVIGDYLYLNVAAYDEEQYPLTIDVGTPIRKSWFDKALPHDAIERFKNNEIPTSYEIKEDMDIFAASGYDEAALVELDKPDVVEIPTVGIDSHMEETKATLEVEKEIGNTDVKYNICTFGSKFHVGFGVTVTIRINGKMYSAKSHKTAKGRIDGMKKLYSENGIVLGDRLKATYIAESSEILLEKIN